MKFMLDTNILIYLIKQRPDKVLQRFAAHSLSDVCISSITVAELEYGVIKSGSLKNKKTLDGWLQLIQRPANNVREFARGPWLQVQDWTIP